MTDLSGKRALVTGASRGIGASIAVALAERGADVAITFERSADRAAGVVRSIEDQGRLGFAIQADSADPAAVRGSVDTAVDRLGGLDILVSNAGIGRYCAVEDVVLADLDRLWNVNVRAAVLAAAAAIPHLGAGGRIISIGSALAERVPFSGATLYAMTKGALVTFTRGLARDLGPRAITVNLVQAGPIDTEMNPAASEHAEAVRSLTALGRYGESADIAAAVAFLASPAASFITGSILTVDGGANA